jgi:membrane peptidoglycan carboxypeptidase
LRTFYGDRVYPDPFAWRIRTGAAAAVRRGAPRLPWWTVVVVLALAGVLELRTSWAQSRVLAHVARTLTYTVEPGAGTSIRFPDAGPYDVRLGYAAQPEFVRRLTAAGFEVEAQARWSPELLRLADAGIFPVYPEKSRAGLVVLDASGQPLFASPHPRHAYGRFAAIPPVIVGSLLFIENRELLRSDHPFRNPAVEYDRLARAVFDVGVNRLFAGHPVSGGSTLATQLEKLRHSPQGRTGSIGEKGRQIVSASLRSYLGGANTLDARRRVLTDYIDSMPLAAIAGHGEVVGLGDGLEAWYGADVPAVNALLGAVDSSRVPDAATRAPTAIAYRQALSLLAAVKKPSAYLARDRDALDRRVDRYLAALASADVIPAWLRDDARRVRVTPRTRVEQGAARFAERKAVDGIRADLAAQLGLPGVHDLDRLDLAVATTLDGTINAAVTQALRRLGTCAEAARAGLLAYRLLNGNDCNQVVYSFTLFERTAGGNVLRVQADNYDLPLNINEGTKLELGSTAKLRTLVTYLELVEQLHRRYASEPAPALRALRVARRDRLTRWAVAYLASAEDRSLGAMLEAAMTRTYPASPDEPFFTGGGLHWFVNFDGQDDGRSVTVREAFERSVNLVFIRLMRDLADHLAFREPDHARMLEDPRHPARAAYLARFADQEGREFLRRFYLRQQPPSARPHPLDAWLRTFLAEHPAATLGDVFAASTRERQQAYEWLFRTSSREAQDRAIGIVLEADAFARIHASWRRHGYPFPSLVPSYATAIGSSGDNPAALAELMGVILNGGVRYDAGRVERLRFAAGTPYETRLVRRARPGTRVLSPAVASLLRRELVNVVEHGTARRLGGVRLRDGRAIEIGGKTGTGDNRFETTRASRVVSRTAAFTFTIGDRFYGSMVAYVPGPEAAEYGFTSALPVQIVKHLLPVLEPLLVFPAVRPHR